MTCTFYQIEALECKLQRSKDDLHAKEFGVLQQDQEINNLKKEIERKEQKITETENVSFFLHIYCLHFHVFLF